MALSNAERQAQHRARIKARLAAAGEGQPMKRTRSAGRLTRPTRWKIAVATLAALLDEYEAWSERLPEAQKDGTTGELLTELLDLRDLVEQLANATLPKGFGRD
jgi:hypothetical protein